MKRDFASDNNAGVHPEVLRALTEANQGHTPAYGGDEYTARAEARFREIFGEETSTFFVFGGTGANALALRHMARSYEGVVCAASSHINMDECGAIEATAGRKLLTVPSSDGKVTVDAISIGNSDRGDVHRVRPRVLSLSQATEYGTVYQHEELRTLCDAAHAAGMLVHMDGARLANAAVALGIGLREVTRDAGVDVVSFGGTKNGLLGAEAVVVFNPELTRGLAPLRKQMLQLASKMRFLSVQFEALLSDDLWHRSAAHANRMAALLAGKVRELPGLTITQLVETNAIFAQLPAAAIERLLRTHRFSIWNPSTNEVRWMTSFDTTEDDVNEFAAAIASALEATHTVAG